MASDASFVEFVVGQARAAGRVESRKMLGEHAVYCDGKVVMLVCDTAAALPAPRPGKAPKPRGGR